jgi:hypothetical protein
MSSPDKRNKLLLPVLLLVVVDEVVVLDMLKELELFNAEESDGGNGRERMAFEGRDEGRIGSPDGVDVNLLLSLW